MTQRTREEVLARVELFIVALQQYCNSVNSAHEVYSYVISAQVGKKNVKIVRRELWKNDEDAEPTNGSVHCFIDIETGNILKAAGWSVPAKGIRGTIFANDFDIGVGRAVGEYGAAYFR